MAKTKLDDHLAEAAVLGGGVLGGGGGGSMADGLEKGRLAVRMGSPVLLSLDELNEEDTVVTASAVGAAAAVEKFIRPVYHVRAMNLLLERRPVKLGGIISNENGGSSGVNGWLEAAVLGVPMVDSPANGRAHPTGLMGAMGLNRVEDYVSIQAAVGGNPETGHYLELVAEGNLERVANLVRYASVQAGGTVAAVREPVSASYLKDHAAPGATSQAIRLGEAMMAVREQGARAIIDAVMNSLGGSLATEGEVTSVRLETVGGYDVGVVTVQGDQLMELTFWNEFMTLESEGRRVGTFPDLIALLSLEDGMPLPSADVRQGQHVAVLLVPRENLILGEGVRLPEALKEAERAVGKPLMI